MKIMIVTDAWEPQVNGVVRTLKSTARELTALGHRVELVTPLEFRTVPCPTYPEIRLSILPYRRLRERLDAFEPHALHIATEGPRGLAAPPRPPARPPFRSFGIGLPARAVAGGPFFAHAARAAMRRGTARHGTLTRNAEHARRDHRRRARSSRFTRASLFDRIGIVRSLSD